MNISEQLKDKIIKSGSTWLITGVSGFIGSNILQALLSLNQKVIGLDNFATGKRENLDDVMSRIDPKLWDNFTFKEGDIRDASLCRELCSQVDIVLHQAALGSVPRSIADPMESHKVNVDGFLNVLLASRDAKVKKFVYASSSSVYGDNATLPKVEDSIGSPLSPYAATKLMNEIYSSVFAKLDNFSSIGLRYFNVFGPRQDPQGQYAAVIPRWISAVIQNQKCTIYGDGTTSRDFCYIENVVEANLLSALSDVEKTGNHNLINIGNQDTTSLNELYNIIKAEVSEQSGQDRQLDPEYLDFRPGDVKHSLANISKARELIGYKPLTDVRLGLKKTVEWFLNKHEL